MAQISTQVKEGVRLRPAMRLVMADFLVRHGIIRPDTEGDDYVQLLQLLHQPRVILPDAG